MRMTLLAAGLLACLGLAACEQSKSGATETAPAPRKSLTRSAQMYAGQEQILSVDTATVEVGKGGGLTLKANGKASAPGYTHLGFLPRINAVLPPDGIYEVDVVADRPAGAVAEAATPIEVKGEWTAYPAARLKGVRFVTKTNTVTAMLPAG